MLKAQANAKKLNETDTKAGEPEKKTSSPVMAPNISTVFDSEGNGANETATRSVERLVYPLCRVICRFVLHVSRWQAV